MEEFEQFQCSECASIGPAENDLRQIANLTMERWVALETELRALAEQWKEAHTRSLIGPLHGAGINDARKWCADELLALLDRRKK